MAAALRSEITATTTPVVTDAAARQQWWEGVQFGVSAMLTEAAHAAPAQRLAG